MKILSLAILFILSPVAVTAQDAAPHEINSGFVDSHLLAGQRTINLTKNRYPTSGAACAAAVNQNPGWTVTKIKLISGGKVWHITLKK